MSPIVTTVAPLKPDMILPAELNLSKVMFICLKAGSCNRSVALPGSTSTLCTLKSLIPRVSTSASWYGVMTLDGLTGGKDIGPVNWLDYSTAIWDVDGIHLGSGCGHSQQPPLLALRLILVVNQVVQYVVYGGLGFRRELCSGRYSFNCGGDLSFADCLPNISPEVAGPD